MGQSPQYNQSRQSQSSASRGNVHPETDQELSIPRNTDNIILLKKLYLKVIKLRGNMKQWNLKMKKLCSKTLKILIMNWTDQCISKKLLLPEKSRLYYSILSLTKLNYFMPYKIKLQWEVAKILSGEREIVSKKF